MDARERSFLEEAQRHLASGRGVDAVVRVYDDGDGVLRIAERATTLLFHAARKGWCSAITWLLKRGADVHVGWPDSGWTPLHVAALHGHLDAAVLLLDADARVDDRNIVGETALHFAAAFEGRIDMCKLLLSRGASLDVRTNYGDDPEARARRSGRTATVDVLAAVRAAGGWRPYCTAQFLELRRELLAPGAVAESSERLYERVFVELPNDVFPRFLAFSF